MRGNLAFAPDEGLVAGRVAGRLNVPASIRSASMTPSVEFLSRVLGTTSIHIARIPIAS